MTQPTPKLPRDAHRIERKTAPDAAQTGNTDATQNDRRDEMTNMLQNPQREDEVSRQRGYGETSGAKDTALEDQPIATATSQTNDEEHGFMRDDGQARPLAEGAPLPDEVTNPVLSPDDNRAPNVTETGGGDAGAIAATPGAIKQMPDGEQILEDAYSPNDPGVETKA